MLSDELLIGEVLSGRVMYGRQSGDPPQQVYPKLAFIMSYFLNF
jgi:hypothetical protein